MQKLLLLLACLLPLAQQAQSYRPFLAGETYTFRFDSSELWQLKADTAFILDGKMNTFFNEIGRELPVNYPDLCPTDWIYPVMDESPDNLFGSRMADAGGGEYWFVTDASDTIFLKLNASGSWLFLSDSSLTASIAGDTFGNFGGVADSARVIQVSDGNRIFVSRDHGIVESTGFNHYFFGEAAKIFSLYSIEGDTAFAQVPQFKEYFDMNVGDEFHYYKWWGYSYPLDQTWYIHKILSKYVSSSADTFIYQTRRKTVKYGFLQTDTIIQTYILSDFPFLNRETKTLTRSADSFFYRLNYRLFINTNWNSRISSAGYDLANDTCNQTASEMLDGVPLITFTAGLGLTNHNYSGMSETHQDLVFYKKGNDSAGTRVDVTAIYRDEGLDEPEIIVGPNPFSQWLKLELTAGNPSKKTQVSLADLQGRIVFKQQYAAFPAQPLDLTKLPSGLYILNIRVDGFADYRVKVVK